MVTDRQAQDFLGAGPIIPLERRGGNDFVFGSGVPLIRSTIRQIIGTRKGEIRWNPAFGAAMDRQRHKLSTESFAAMVAEELQAAIRQFEPRVRVIDVKVTRFDTTVIARINWSIIDRNVAGNRVLLGPDTFEVKI